MVPLRPHEYVFWASSDLNFKLKVKNREWNHSFVEFPWNPLVQESLHFTQRYRKSSQNNVIRRHWLTQLSHFNFPIMNHFLILLIWFPDTLIDSALISIIIIIIFGEDGEFNLTQELLWWLCLFPLNPELPPPFLSLLINIFSFIQILVHNLLQILNMLFEGWIFPFETSKLFIRQSLKSLTWKSFYIFNFVAQILENDLLWDVVEDCESDCPCH